MPNELTEKSVAQTEVTLAALREPALKLLMEGVESAYSSQAHRTKDGLQVDTTEKKGGAVSTMVVDGKASGTHRTIDMKGIHFDMLLTGDFTVTHINGQNRRVEKDHFELSGSDLDEYMNRPDKFTVSLKRTAQDGTVLQSYDPAISEVQRARDGSPIRDANGQPVRIARPADGEANCGMENIYNPGNKRMECDYIIHDGKLGDLSYNEVREKEAGWYYRSVVRDMKGNVLGIVQQSFDLDKNGDIVSVSTSARKPRRTTAK